MNWRPKFKADDNVLYDNIPCVVVHPPEVDLGSYVLQVLDGPQFCAAEAELTRRYDFTQARDIAAVLADSGYMLTSNKYGIVSRVDRPGPCKHGFDFYRRCNSSDKIEGLPQSVCKLLRSQYGTERDRDTVGYRPRHPLVDEAVAACAGWKEKERLAWIEYHRERGTLRNYR